MINIAALKPKLHENPQQNIIYKQIMIIITLIQTLNLPKMNFIINLKNRISKNINNIKSVLILKPHFTEHRKNL